MPGTAKQFLGSVQPKPMGQMIMYLGIMSLLPLIGFLLGGLIAGGLVWGLVFGIVMAIGLIVAAIGSGFVLSILGEGMLGRKIAPEEGITLCGYAMTPVFVVAFLSGILAFMWQISFLGMLLLGVSSLYMAYLIFISAGVRYGQDKAIIAAIVVLIVTGIILWIFWSIAWSVVWGMIVGARLGPYGGYYGRYAAAYL